MTDEVGFWTIWLSHKAFIRESLIKLAPRKRERGQKEVLEGKLEKIREGKPRMLFLDLIKQLRDIRSQLNVLESDKVERTLRKSWTTFYKYAKNSQTFS